MPEQLPLIELTPTSQPVTIAPPAADLYMVAGWWPHGGYWSVKGGLFTADDAADDQARRMAQSGWTHLVILHVRLPAAPLAADTNGREKSDDASDALLEAQFQILGEAVATMRKRVWLPWPDEYIELPGGAVPCDWLEKRAAELQARKAKP